MLIHAILAAVMLTETNSAVVKTETFETDISGFIRRTIILVD